LDYARRFDQSRSVYPELLIPALEPPVHFKLSIFVGVVFLEHTILAKIIKSS
jgi:hypothetical protein